MSKFRNTHVSTKIENRAGGEAFAQSPKLELVSLLLTSFVADQYYRTASEQLDKLTELVGTIKDKKFIGQSAVYARQEFGMRSITHALIGELVKVVKGEQWTKNAVEKTVHRPDDMLEMLGYYKSKYGKPIPNSLKKGLTSALNKFDEYQIAKYRGSKSSMKMVDLVNLLHPKVKKELQDTIKKLMKNELKSKDTWEVKQTQAGQAVKDIKDEKEKKEKLAELKKQNWEQLFKEKKLGYFALLRNLRNILEQAPDLIDDVVKELQNKNRIEKSLVLPFRFNTAIQEIKKVSFDKSRDIVESLGKALEISLSNVPKFDGKTLVVLDESGSMDGKPIEIGSIFASVLYKTNNADLMSFSEDARYRTLNPSDSALTIADTLQRDSVSRGTSFHSIFQKADKKYDRIIILSDMQGWIDYDTPTQSFADYKKRTGANPFIYSFDLQGYGDMQFPEKQVFCIAGFSDKIFDVIKLLEQDKNALIKEIEKVEL